MFEFFDEPIDAKEVDNALKNAGPVPPGIYEAVVEGVTDGCNDNGKEFCEVTYKIIGGVCEGREVKEKYYDPAQADGEDKQKNARSRLAAVCHRLGMLTKVGDKLVLVKGKSSLKDCLGAKCWIKVINEPYTNAKGAQRLAARLEYWGVLNPEEAKKELAKLKNTSAEPAKKGATTTPKKSPAKAQAVVDDDM